MAFYVERAIVDDVGYSWNTYGVEGGEGWGEGGYGRGRGGGCNYIPFSNDWGPSEFRYREQEMQRSFRAARKSDTIHCPVNLSNHRLKPAGKGIMHLSLSENQALAFLSYKI